MIQDTTPRLPTHPIDSVVDNPLLGDKVTPVIQWIFQQEPWVMWGGVVVGLVVAGIILRWLWRRRDAILTWIRTRSRGVKLALVGAAGLAVLAAAGVGYGGYHFVETDRRFCNGCHIFVPGGQTWAHPDTGYYSLVPRLEGKHDTINCHTCHTLRPLKEGVKMVFWMSGFRDKEIPEHGKVPRQICEDCHVQGAAKETWQAIATTAGHRTHFESDSSALKDKVECLTCHARTAHRFQPADTTCVQKGCHLTDETRIALGKMSGQTDLHCTLCHEFARPVALLATRDSAASALKPGQEECFTCHQMKEQLPGFSSVNDPHNGTCGTCHNPHDQRTAAETRKSCTDAACHADWRKDPFHTGAQHRKKAEQCILCHQPHAAKVDQSDCVGCHTTIRSRPGGEHLAPPLPFDTTKVLKQSFAPLEAPPDDPPLPPERPSKVKGDAPPWEADPGRPPGLSQSTPVDTFSHPTHKKLACLTCHLSASGAKLTFEAPRGCQICHHQQPAKAECAKCHEEGSLPEAIAMQVSVAAAGKPGRDRTVAFRHDGHTDLACGACHGQAVTLAPVDSAATCQGCHEKHHESERQCAACHRAAMITPAHERPARTHVACDACHATAAIASLKPTRTFCLACHDAGVDHYPTKECSRCHLGAHPEDYRPRLLKLGSTG